MSKTLLIYGAGGFGIEVLDICHRHPEWTEYSPIFIDDFDFDRQVLGIQVISFDHAQNRYRDCNLIIASGDPITREKMFARASSSQFELPKIIDPTSIISENASVGIGTVVCPYAVIGPRSQVSNNVLVNTHSIVGHDVIVGRNSVLASMVNIGGHAAIGENSMVGMNSSIRPKAKVGNNCLIAMQSCVLNDIVDNVIAVGNPARPSRRNKK